MNKEDIKFLKELKEELKTQDNRFTRNPLYVIMDKKELVTAEGYNEHRSCWVDDEGTEWGTLKDLYNYLSENYTEELSAHYKVDLDEEVDLTEAFLDDNEYSNSISIDGLLNTFNLVHLQEIDNIKGSGVYSFFENDAKDHLKSNSYHYNKGAHTYACGLWRSPRMEKLLNWIKEVDLDKIKTH